MYWCDVIKWNKIGLWSGNDESADECWK